MRVDRVDEVIHSSFERDRRNSLSNHFRHGVADHVNAKNLTVRLLGNNLNEPVACILDFRLGNRRERKFAYFDLKTSFSRSSFGQTDAGDLRITIRTGWN